MKKQQKIGYIFLLMLLVTVLSACSAKTQGNETNENETNESKTIRVGSLIGPTSMGLVKMMEDMEAGNIDAEYLFTMSGAADEISTGLVKGEFDIAAIPCNLASVLYNQTEGELVTAGINTLGVLYIVETKDSIQSVADLKGKTIYSTGKGTTPEYTLNYLLRAYEIDPEKDVTIEYKSEATEVAAMLAESEDAIAMLPQPFVTTAMMNNEKIRIALDITKEWEAINPDSTIVTGLVVVRKEFLEQNKELVDQFLTHYKESVTYVNENIKDASALIEKFKIFKAAVAEKAIPLCNITFIEGEEMKHYIQNYLNVLYEQNPKTVGGSLPEDDFYYIK